MYDDAYTVHQFPIDQESGVLIGAFGEFKTAKKFADECPKGCEREVRKKAFEIDVLIYRKRSEDTP